MKRWLLAAAVVAAASVVGTAVSSPTTPTFDRGMPTTNLNNAAGANRSNVAWSFGNDYVTGDNFKIGATGEKYYITTLRTWNVGESSGMPKLYLGTSVGIAEVPGLTVNRTPVKYTGNLDYQTTGGSFSTDLPERLPERWVGGRRSDVLLRCRRHACRSNQLLVQPRLERGVFRFHPAGSDGTFNYWPKNGLASAPATVGQLTSQRWLGQVERHQRPGLRLPGSEEQGRLQERRLAVACPERQQHVQEPGRLHPVRQHRQVTRPQNRPTTTRGS